MAVWRRVSRSWSRNQQRLHVCAAGHSGIRRLEVLSQFSLLTDLPMQLVSPFRVVRDPNQLAMLIIDIAKGRKPDCDLRQKNKARSPSHESGSKLRAATLTREQRTEIAKRAASSWQKRARPAPGKKERV